MAWSFVQSKITGALADPQTVVYDSTPTTGNLLLASVWDNSGANTPTVSDSGGNWSQIASQAGSVRSLLLYGKIAVSSQPTSIQSDRSTDQTLMNLYEFSGNQASLTGIVDQASGASIASSVNTSGSQPSITSTVADCLIFSMIGWNSAVTVPVFSDGTFTAGQVGPVGTIQLADWYKASSGTGTFNPSVSWTTARACIQLITSIKPAAVGGSQQGLWAGF